MECFSLSELTCIGSGSNSVVYRLNRLYSVNADYQCPVVIKVGRLVSADNYIRSINLLRGAGLQTIAFAIPCQVDGQNAVILPDVNSNSEIFVSPNTIRNGHLDSEAEAYLLSHKIEDIANFDMLLMNLRDVAHCADGRGIGLDMDMIFFSVEKDVQIPNVFCKLVDIDSMLQDDAHMYKLTEYNISEAKYALQLFIEYFISTLERKTELLKQMNAYNW